MSSSETRLGPDDHKRILLDRVIPKSGIPDTTAQEMPRAVILAGQPGAGKGGLTRLARAEFEQNVVVLDPDALRDYHPEVDRFRDVHPYTWAGDTHHDASKWNNEVRGAAIEGRRNLIVDTTLGNGNSAVKLVKELQSKGYDVEIRGLVAHSLESELGVDTRFGERFDDEGFGRFVPENVRQEVYQALPGNLDKIHTETGIQIRLYNREGRELYDNRTDPRMPGPAMDSEREHRLSDPRLTQTIRDGWKERVGWHRDLPDALPNNPNVAPDTANAMLSERAELKVAEAVSRETTTAIQVDHEVRVRPNMIRGAAIGGTAVTAVEAVAEGRKIADLYGRDNPIGAQAAIVDFGARSVGGFAGAVVGAKVGTLVGIESGPGAIVTGLIGAGVGAMGASAAVEWIEKYQINNQRDATGKLWTFDPENPSAGWTRTEREVIGSVGTLVDRPIYGPTQEFTADPVLAQELNYKASSKAIGLRLGEPDRPIPPYSIPGDSRDTPSIYPASWERNPLNGEWRREVVVSELEHGIKNVQVEFADPQKAKHLDEYAAGIIAYNASRSPAAMAKTFEDTHAQLGWQQHGKVPDAVTWARNHTDEVLASDGRAYQRGKDGEWTHDGVFWDSKANGNLRDELDATYLQVQTHYARTADAPAQVSAAAQNTPDAVTPLATAPAMPVDDMRQPGHPGNRTYMQMMDRVSLFDSQQGLPTGEHSQRLAASTAVIANRERLDPDRTFVEKSPQSDISLVERPRPGQSGERRFEIDIRALSSRPIEESSRELANDRSAHYFNPPAAARTVEQELVLQRMAPSDKAMFERIRTGTPASVADEAVLSAVTASKQRGIDQADKISAVAMDGDRLFVMGNTPGFRSMTDVSQPQPELQRGVEQLQTQNQQQSLDQQRQQSEEQQRSASKSAAISM